ncbi:MAG: WecB/TagA/CpsF family glycosyltransferase [Proteobacteria bacterium]|nr:WecB/TagA/CpsF family glycosyltransferase [Pseudomonadota bacterium]
MSTANSEDTDRVETETRRVERVCGIPVHCWPREEILVEIDRNIKGSRKRFYICVTNTESMYHARRDLEHRAYIEQARFSLCDGIGSAIGGRFQGKRISRFNGPVFMEKSCAHGTSRKWRHFFCGGREGVAKMLSEKLARRFPGMIIAGVYCPPFRKSTRDEEEEMVRTINKAKPDIVWVGLGLLKQEKWIRDHIDRIDAPWMAGVGAAFDFHAGTARWAPGWIQRIGMEWLYRLCFEPRMFKRNVRSFIFLFEAMLEGLFGKAPVIGGRERSADLQSGDANRKNK